MTLNIARVEDRLTVVSAPVGVSVYDFDFDLHFRCTHPSVFREGERCVLRVGPLADYEAEFAAKAEWGLQLINSPEEHRRASDLEAWYPLLEDLTPRTVVFDTLPDASGVEALGWPVFVKGARQTSKHDPALSIAGDAAEYEALRLAYREDPILHWQRAAVREFITLEPVAGAVPNKVRPSHEFRTFWWRGALVGYGRYWFQVPHYDSPDLAIGLEVAREAADRLKVPFLVVDIARTLEGRWIVIECNDGQESGYVGISPVTLWRNILEHEAG